VKEMLKEVRGVKVSGWLRLVIFLGLWVVFLNLLAGCGRETASGMPSQPPSHSQTSTWVELAPGIRYQEEEGRFSLEILPPLLTEESVRKFTEFAQRRMAQAAYPEEKEAWEENLRFVEEQYALWSDEELVVSVLEHAISNRFPLPQEEAQRQELRAKLREVVRQMKRHGPDNLPPDEYWQNLLPELKTP
jgi:hypothetical protein